jgi:hypothetical protein
MWWRESEKILTFSVHLNQAQVNEVIAQIYASSSVYLIEGSINLESWTS